MCRKLDLISYNKEILLFSQCCPLYCIEKLFSTWSFRSTKIVLLLWEIIDIIIVISKERPFIRGFGVCDIILYSPGTCSVGILNGKRERGGEKEGTREGRKEGGKEGYRKEERGEGRKERGEGGKEERGEGGKEERGREEMDDSLECSKH